MGVNWKLIVILLSGVIHVAYCESAVDFNPDNAKIGRHNSNHSVKQSSELGGSEPLLEGRSLHKRGYFGEGNEKDTDSEDYSEKFLENQKYGSKRKNDYNEDESERSTYDYRQEGYMANEKSRVPYASGLDMSLDDEGVRSTYMFKNRKNSRGRNDWEKKDFFDERHSQLNEHRDSHYPSTYSDVRGVNNYDRRTSSAHRDVKLVNNFNSDSELMSRMHSRYPSHSTDYSKGSSELSRNPNFYNGDKALIINFKTECPFSKQSKSQLVHKFVFAPKSQHLDEPEPSFQNTGSSLIGSSHMMPPPFYYV